MSRKKKITRRRLLAGTGALAASLPFLNRAPSAEAAGGPKKLLVMFTPNSVMHSSVWAPSAGTFNMPEVMAELRPYNDRILFMDGLHIGPGEADQKGGHNCMGMVLTGTSLNYPGTATHVFKANGPSIDYVIGDELGEEPLNLGVRSERDYGTYLSTYSAAQTSAVPIEDPARAFTRAFGDDGGMAEPGAGEVLAAQRRSVLDYAAGQLGDLRTRVPRADQIKLERHLDEIASLEARFGRPAVTCDATMEALGYDPLANANVPRTIDDQIDVAVQALRCGVTRVATVQIGSSASCGTPRDWDGVSVSTGDGEHDIIHDWRRQESGPERDNSMAVSNFYGRKTAYLLEQLGDDLDDTIVLWVKHIGYNHTFDNVPMMLIGGNGDGCYRSGRHLDLSGTSHNNVLASVCNMMGMSVSSFGEERFCTGVADLT